MMLMGFGGWDRCVTRTLHETGRLHRFTTSCVHNDYASPCFEHYFIPNVLPILLNSTIPNL